MTLTIELPQEVVDGLSRVAAEKQVTVEAVLQDLAATAAKPEYDSSGAIDAQGLHDLINFGRLHGISGEGFDAIAAQHDGHRY